MVGILGSIFLTTSTGIPTEEDSSQQITTNIDSIKIDLESVSILEVSDRSAVIEMQLKLENPNPRAVIAQYLQYSLYASDNGEEMKISAGTIGSRPEGMVDASNYYTLLSNGSIVLKDKIVLEYPGNNPELISLLNNSETDWRAEGIAFFNLSSMTSGQENEVRYNSKLNQ